MSDKRIGRPPTDNPRRNTVVIRLADDELATCDAAAERAGQTRGEWMRSKILAAAKRQR